MPAMATQHSFQWFYTLLDISDETAAFGGLSGSLEEQDGTIEYYAL